MKETLASNFLSYYTLQKFILCCCFGASNWKKTKACDALPTKKCNNPQLLTAKWSNDPVFVPWWYEFTVNFLESKWSTQDLGGLPLCNLGHLKVFPSSFKTSILRDWFQANLTDILLILPSLSSRFHLSELLNCWDMKPIYLLMQFDDRLILSPQGKLPPVVGVVGADCSPGLIFGHNSAGPNFTRPQQHWITYSHTWK